MVKVDRDGENVRGGCVEATRGEAKQDERRKAK